MKEYKRSVRKIWESELNGSNKVTTAHNTLAVPVITPTIGILNVNRLYVPKKQGGRRLTSIEDVYIARNIILADHLLENKETNRY